MSFAVMELKQFSLSTCFTIIGTILFLYIIYLKRKLQYWTNQGIQTPVDGIWSVIKGIYKFRYKPIHLLVTEQYEKYGRVFGTYMGFKPQISIGDPDILKRILVKDFNMFHNRMKLKSGNKLFDKMLSLLEDDDWKRIRCIMSPTFSSGKIRKMAYLVKECAEKFSENLKKIADENKTQSVDCKSYLNCFSIDVIASTAFGTKLSSLDDPNNEFVTMARKATNIDTPIWALLLILFPKLSILIKVDVFAETFNFFKNFTLHVIDRREKEKTKSNDFLQLLLDAQKGSLEISPEDANEDDYDKEQYNFKTLPKHKTMSSEEMMAQCAMILFGGSDTTTNTLSFVLYHLALSPECQDKLIQEVDDLWSNNEDINFDVLSKTIYLDAVINETLRLNSIAIQLVRECTEEYELQELGIKIPKGMNVLIPVYAMHRDKEFFPNPEKFDPDRFMPENKNSIPQYAYLPFGEGPRNCIGMRFAFMTLKMCLVYIFRDIRVEATEETKQPLDFYLGQGILQPKKIMVNYAMELNQFIPSTWITLIASVLLLCVIYLRRRLQFWKRQGIQCAINGIYSFVLETSKIFKKPIHLIELEYYNKYGRIHGRFIGIKPNICIGEPHILKKIFVKDFNTFHNRVRMQTGSALFDKSLFIVQDEDWKRIRCIMSPTFSSGKMRKMSYLINECAEKFSENLKKIADENKNNSIDCKNYLSCFTIDVIASTAFGTKLCSLEDPNSEFVVMSRKATNKDVTFSDMILMLFPALIKFVKMTPFEESLNYYKNFILHVINKREKEKLKAYDFLQLLLDAQKGVLEISSEEAKEEEMSNFKILPKHKTMSSDEMMAQCTLFLFAGNETTTNTVAFVLYYMALYPEYQAKLLREIDEIWKTNDEMNFDVLNKMQYMDAVINETLRLKPALSQLVRECDEEYELPELGIKILKGMNIIIPVYPMHYDKEFFPNPEKFDPDRFLSDNRSSIIPFTYLPFGEGPRNCLGMRFALMVVKMCLVYIFRDLRVEATQETKVTVFLVDCCKPAFAMELRHVTPFTFITIIASFLLLFIIYVSRKLQYWKRQGIESPIDGIWSFVSETSKIFKKQLHIIELEYYKKYGRIHGRIMGFKPTLCVADPQILKKVFVKDFNTFHNRMEVKTGNALFDKMLSFLQDDDWKRIRCIVSPTFSSGKMRKMAYLVKECAEKFSENLKKIPDENENNCIDSKIYMNCFTIDVIASTAFGTKLSSLEDPNNEFVTMSRKAINKDVSFLSMLLFIFPILTKFTRVKSFDETFNYYENFILHVINQREKEKMKAYDFLQLLLDAQKGVLEISPEEANEEEMSNFKTLPKHKTMNTEEMMAQCTLFLFAGNETTTNALAFVLYYMALHPEYQDKLIEEVDEIWKTNSEMNFDVLNKIQYMDAVINETLRKQPALLQLARECTEEYELPELGIKIPKGMNILIPIYAMHYDKEFFPNPEKFDPDRFLPENRSSIIPFTYLPFGEGPRNCVGMRFALMVVKMCLVYIFRDLRVEATEETKMPLEYYMGQGLLQPKKLMIKLVKRK
ncbi:uncharacterized protein [Centruroides vittatus]|uniref:uncharacterized protein n=1 Tax=Centruroides vittatus TaxID=120091 RepID=UPI00350FAD28